MRATRRRAPVEQGDGAWRELLDRLRALRWTVSNTPGGHVRLQPPCGPPIFCSATPRNSWRSLLNTRALARRRGADV